MIVGGVTIGLNLNKDDASSEFIKAARDLRCDALGIDQGERAPEIEARFTSRSSDEMREMSSGQALLERMRAVCVGIVTLPP
jgi:hypothetical protein